MEVKVESKEIISYIKQAVLQFLWDLGDALLLGVLCPQAGLMRPDRRLPDGVSQVLIGQREIKR